MDKQFPPMMKADMHTPGVKQAWVSDFPIVHPSDCPNCAGAGLLTLQVALAGPFRSPPTGRELSAKFDVLNGQMVWWGVKTKTYECPVCKGGRQFAQSKAPITNPDIVELAHDLAHEPEKQKELDWQQYTD